jgi:hypothetical protein
MVGDIRVVVSFSSALFPMRVTPTPLLHPDREGNRKRRLTNPTSSNKFGNIQIAFLQTTTVIHQNINLTIARTIKAPSKPRARMDKYQTPILNFTGHKGNMTPANMIITIAAPPRIVVRGEPS